MLDRNLGIRPEAYAAIDIAEIGAIERERASGAAATLEDPH